MQNVTKIRTYMLLIILILKTRIISYVLSFFNYESIHSVYVIPVIEVKLSKLQK